MPKILSIEPRDICFIFELTLKEIVKLNTVANMMVIDFDGNKEEEVQAKDYFINDFFPLIKDIAEKYKDVESNNK